VDDKKGNVSVLYAPDKGFLIADIDALNVGAVPEVLDQLFVHRESFCLGAPLDEDVLNRTLVRLSPTLRARIGVEPQVKSIDVKVNMSVMIGGQRIRVDDVSQSKDGRWEVILSIELLADSVDSEFAEQLLKRNTYTITYPDGRQAPLRMQHTSLACDKNTLTFSCEQRPVLIGIRGYSRVIQENLALPREHLPHPKEPGTIEP
jgi:hypothetical protein